MLIWTQSWEENQKTILQKNFLRWSAMQVFRKTMENARKHRDIKLSTTEARRNYLVSKANYQTNFVFLEIC